MPKPKVFITAYGDNRREMFTERMLDRLREFAEPVLNDLDRPLTADEAKERIADCDAILTTWGTPKFTTREVKAAPRLRVIAHAAGSLRSVVDPEVLDLGVTVTHAAAGIAPMVGEMALALTLACLRRLTQHDRVMKRDPHLGEERRPDANMTLLGARVGLVGFGWTAREYVRLLEPFGCDVCACDPFASAEAAAEHGVRLVSLEEALRHSRVVSLHAAKLEFTHHMIGREELAMLPDGAVLINTARGSLIDEEALIAELRTGRIWAGLDVTESEPPGEDSPLRSLPNVILTPHVAGPTTEGRWLLVDAMIEELRRVFVEGKEPLFKVTKDKFEYMA